MAARFAIRHWAAIAPGLRTHDDWLAWAASPRRPEGAVEAPLLAMPAMQRRRVERVGRLALQVAYDVDAMGDAPDVATRPMVFASRHGDVLRSVGLLETLDRAEPLSPTQFGLSVHNAVAAQYGIARGSIAPYSAVAGGRFSAEAGVLEALAFLDDGHDEVLLVVYDEPPPVLFERDADEPPVAFAWAARLTRSGAGFGLQSSSIASAAPPHALPAIGALADVTHGLSTAVPHSLAVLAFLLQPRAEWRVAADGAVWRWTHGR